MAEAYRLSCRRSDHPSYFPAIVRKPATPARRDGAKSDALRRILGKLRTTYGRPKPPLSDPFALILMENVAYLADDARRDEAMEMLRAATGLSPARILAAPPPVLLAVARKGILAAERVERLRNIASIALDLFDADLEEVVRRPPKEASKALRRFPSIGVPGAEKILLFSKRWPVLALESNGLRVLLRLGFGTEEKSYSASYRSAQKAAGAELPSSCDDLIEAHQLLRTHGQELCRRSAPLCERCPVTKDCAYYRRSAPAR
jgi:endonuclease III